MTVIVAGCMPGLTVLIIPIHRQQLAQGSIGLTIRDDNKRVLPT
jgi:hypothetical protein